MKRTALFGVICMFSAVGCELIVDYDRSKIPVDLSDASNVGDVTQIPFPDGSFIEASVSDGSVFDGASDAGSDASSDAATDGG